MSRRPPPSEASADPARPPLDARAPDLLALLADAVAILDEELRPRFLFPTPTGLQGFAGADDTTTRLEDWIHADDGLAVLAALERARRSPGEHATVRTRVRNDFDGWHEMELEFHNRLDHPDVQGIVVRVRNLTVYDRELRWRELVQEAPVGIFETDAFGRFTFVNPWWCLLSGQSSADAVGYGWTDALHVEDRDKVIAQWARASAAGEGFAAEYRFVREQGEPVWVSARAIPLHEQDGTISGYTGTVEDITDRRRVEELRRENEQRVRRLLDSSPDIVVTLDVDGCITYVSPAVKRVLGVAPEDQVGRSVLDFLHPDDVGYVGEIVRLVTSTPAPTGPMLPQELRLRHADGTYRHVEVLATNLLDDAVVRGLLVSIRDVTERNGAEARLHEAEARAEVVFENAAVGMHVVAVNGQFLRVNRAECVMLGYLESQLLNTNFGALAHPEDVARLREAHRRLVSGDVASVIEEVRLRGSDGDYIWARLSAAMVRDDTDQPQYLIGQLEDVTERHRLAAELAFEATHDRLTGLAGRALMFDYVQRAFAQGRRDGSSLALLFLDLDGFKLVNDTLGHGAGDELLVRFADRLRQVVRGGDVAVRLGGDEFVVVCPEIEGPNAALELADRMLATLKAPYEIQGHEVSVGSSIGIAIASSEEGVTPEQLLHNADTAAYRAKRSGPGRVELFDDIARRQLAQRRHLERVIAHELERNGKLPLKLRPIRQVSDGVVVGFDATVNWKTLDVDATTVARLLAETSLALLADRALMRSIVRLLARWEASPPAGGRLGLAMSMTTRSALRSEFADALRVELKETNVPPTLCWIGVPESAFARDFTVASRFMSELVDLDCGVALSDFGAGLSSLEHLRRLPSPSLRLHESLARGLAAGDEYCAALVPAVLRLAQTLGLITTAGGVDSVNGLARLGELGCMFAFGQATGPELESRDFSA